MAKPRIGGRLVDVRPDRVDLRDRIYQPPLVSLPAEYPEHSVRDALLPRYRADGMILDQGREGACTGFGLAAVINYLLWRREIRGAGRRGWTSRAIDKVSPRMLYHLARIYDEWPGEDYEGSSCRGAMKGWHRHGVCSDRLWPYARDQGGKRTPTFVRPTEGWARDAATRPLGAYYRIDRAAVADLQSAIHEVGAVYVSADVHRGWNVDRSDTLPVIRPRSAITGGHAFALVGYDARGFIVQNSWGADWAYQGFAILSYEDWVRHGMDAWVAVMGAAVELMEDTPARSTNSLRLRADRAPVTLVGAGKGGSHSYRNPRAAPWSESLAYRHTVVIGNDGRPLNRLIDVEDARAAIELITRERPRAWLARQASPRLAVYAHGGLNDEAASVDRIRVLAPYFLENGVYPLFLTWRTGVVESIAGMLEDQLMRLLPEQRAEFEFGDALDWMKNKLADVRDRTIELAAERILVRGIWSQMKQNAAAALLADAAGHQAARCLGQLQAELPGLEIHLVGHSAGAILHGHLLSRLREQRTSVESVTLFAPACTVDFAVAHYGAALEARALAPSRLHVELLGDAAERADTVGPYGKSLLYLVSRALEITHKTPLLGMEIAWQTSPKSMQWERSVLGSIAAWRKIAGDAVKPRLLEKGPVADSGSSTIPLAHGSFDNDVEVITRLLKRLSARPKLTVPVENLRGY